MPFQATLVDGVIGQQCYLDCAIHLQQNREPESGTIERYVRRISEFVPESDVDLDLINSRGEISGKEAVISAIEIGTRDASISLQLVKTRPANK